MSNRPIRDQFDGDKPNRGETSPPPDQDRRDAIVSLLDTSMLVEASAEDFRLREQAWGQYITELITQGDPLLDRLEELGLDRNDLKASYLQFAEYPDVDRWPTEELELPDLVPARNSLTQYLTRIKRITPTLPWDPGRDKLIPQYQRIARLGRQLNLARPARLIPMVYARTNPRVQSCFPCRTLQQTCPEC